MLARTIKFRAWDTDINRMVSVEGNIARFHDGEVQLIKPSLKLMQFTGLLDKNGKEMCEGDILHLQDEEVNAEVVWDIHLAAYYIKKSNKGVADRLCDYWQHNAPEVIGNIYENPELLSV